MNITIYLANVTRDNQNNGMVLFFRFFRCALIICAAASFGEVSIKNGFNLKIKLEMLIVKS